jgi:glutamate synthase domain-containing protein 1
LVSQQEPDAYYEETLDGQAKEASRMCGIVGLLILERDLERELGRLLTAMLVQMTERGPDSAGVAVYVDGPPGGAEKYSCRGGDDAVDWTVLGAELGAAVTSYGNTAVLTGPAGLRRDLEARGVRVVSSGRDLEVFKGLGLPAEISDQYRLPSRHGYLAVGHTRMATESAVTTDGSHPFSTHDDLCVVHNGSFSNYFTVRRDLEGQGERFLTDNDTEVAARLIGREMDSGRDLGDAIRVLQKEMDGFYTLVCSTRDQMAVVRDEFGCKPAMVAVGDRYVAVASEFRALAVLPDIASAEVFEPTPTEIYLWDRSR